MTRTTTTAADDTAARSDPHRRWLACGAGAGLLFPVVSFSQVITRPGFNLRFHPLSALSLGDLGWLQITNFLLTGILAVAFALGLRRALRPGRAGTWGPILITAYGIGMICAGIFVTDPGFGFPAGAPAGLPEQFSVNAVLHAVAAMLAFVSLTAACLVFARRFAAQRRRGWATYSVATGIVAFALTVIPAGTDTASVRFAIGAVLTSVWLAVIALRLRTDLSRT